MTFAIRAVPDGEHVDVLTGLGDQMCHLFHTITVTITNIFNLAFNRPIFSGQTRTIRGQGQVRTTPSETKGQINLGTGMRDPLISTVYQGTKGSMANSRGLPESTAKTKKMNKSNTTS